MAFAVEFEPVPAMTLQRPRAVSTASSMTPHVFLVLDRRRFARGADRNDAVDAGGDLPFDQRDERCFVDRAVAKRGDERGVGALKHRVVRCAGLGKVRSQISPLKTNPPDRSA